jgi:hypothetical protein
MVACKPVRCARAATQGYATAVQRDHRSSSPGSTSSVTSASGSPSAAGSRRSRRPAPGEGAPGAEPPTALGASSRMWRTSPRMADYNAKTRRREDAKKRRENAGHPSYGQWMARMELHAPLVSFCAFAPWRLCVQFSGLQLRIDARTHSLCDDDPGAADTSHGCPGRIAQKCAAVGRPADARKSFRACSARTPTDPVGGALKKRAPIRRRGGSRHGRSALAA